MAFVILRDGDEFVPVPERWRRLMPEKYGMEACKKSDGRIYILTNDGTHFVESPSELGSWENDEDFKKHVVSSIIILLEGHPGV